MTTTRSLILSPHEVRAALDDRLGLVVRPVSKTLVAQFDEPRGPEDVAAGYVSPEEQAAKDAEAEARAVSLARQSADQARFEAWRDSLSPSELKNALQGHPGGSRDAWLKRMWREKREAGELSG